MDIIKETAEKLREADALLIGASNGLSITEGLHLFADNQAFEDLFRDLKRSMVLHVFFMEWVRNGLPKKKNGDSGAALSVVTAKNTRKLR